MSSEWCRSITDEHAECGAKIARAHDLLRQALVFAREAAMEEDLVDNAAWAGAFAESIEIAAHLVERIGVKRVGHQSDCELHNEPAYRNGPCSCGATKP